MTARGALAERLGKDNEARTKTLIIEVHTNDSTETLHSLFGADSVEPTSDAFLYRARVESGELWVDQLDERFWSVHTGAPLAQVRRHLHERVQSSHDLDWMWLPTQHLERVHRHTPAQRIRTNFSGSDLRGAGAPGAGLRLHASGRDAGSLVDLLERSSEFAGAVALDSVQIGMDDGTGGVMKEAVDRKGVFLGEGDSFDTHVQFVRSVVRRYGVFVSLLEAKSVRWEVVPDGGGQLTGSPVGVLFSRPVPDVARFAENLFTSREPFRLWGSPTVSEGVAEVDAVDLHVGQRVRIDIGPQWMRVHLEEGSCGNTVARLISNLQHRFDSRLTLSDPQLQAALTATAPEQL